MFCKNCGASVNTDDVFCGECGGRVNSTGSTENIRRENIARANNEMVGKAKNYFMNPVSFLSQLGEDNLMKKILIFALGLPVLSGIINILYSSIFIKAILKTVEKIPNIFGKGMASSLFSTGIKMSDEYRELKDMLENLLDKNEIFMGGFIHVLGIIIITFIIIEIINIAILKGKMHHEKIMLLSAVSYIPLIVCMLAGAVGTYFSILFGFFMILSGYILSFINLYNGLKLYTKDEEDMVYKLMGLFFIILSVILSFIIVTQFKSSISSLMNTISMFYSFF
ncbi:zinc ribbon domain-containing protein [uncultured Clostridium sp.]|mgnify:CR=1 FL=1|uniref:zinc ribbon domain-containing protein n=1 Tax=uncultured Clostridium sp. TaxID=59620 RepID=UPI0025ED77CA|nr:hypothetical protein [uncultured Clostridium sp.]